MSADEPVLYPEWGDPEWVQVMRPVPIGGGFWERMSRVKDALPRVDELTRWVNSRPIDPDVSPGEFCLAQEVREALGLYVRRDLDEMRDYGKAQPAEVTPVGRVPIMECDGPTGWVRPEDVEPEDRPS